jgi:hypothetical protein
MSRQEMRKFALRRYVVFRVKAIEFLDMGGLHQGLLNGSIKPYPPFRTASNMADSLKTVLLSWFALFVDKNAMNVIELWQQVFPQHAKLEKETWAKMEPTWPVLREFRNRAGFHADKPRRFFGARHRLRVEIKHVEAALLEFEKLFKFLLSVEAKELPDLEEALDDLLDELEKAHGGTYKREQLKAYMMVPDTHRAKPKAIAKPAS